MIYSHFNELRKYNQRTHAERMDAIIAKVSVIGLVVYIILGVMA